MPRAGLFRRASPISSDSCPIWLGILLVAAGTLLGYAVALMLAGLLARW
jgi:hypothetical protein